MWLIKVDVGGRNKLLACVCFLETLVFVSAFLQGELHVITKLVLGALHSFLQLGEASNGLNL